ncbi:MULTISPECIES: ABC transporter ATP-binding protein [unclassified Haloferax]|uniref:ABC transporter ATP-binding protein n=1 Tax=Haloferax TaxID=2251 RepID=UPI0002B24292|nr:MULTISPECIES: ABC transporter ATP-binding protein [unclassified Haloferax]ELZ59232.1 sugar ABC transporter ATP-binding protein [Haloferax sp. ATCC BAA-646]ELZ60038.1 sugar ABC transporter ATP-binding protein [Haloferax sp. ATCC BAA-645]ELZ72067.1 sugar ABC transporter ATP-binding protein [Haloferax sp. ATCC BAA-644]
MATSIHLDTVRKEFRTLGNTHVAVDDLSLDIPEGSFTTFVGPSGCGKTTTLRMLAGLETPTSGTVSFGDEDVTDLPPQERNVSMVFQSIALYPHMSVRENIGYGLKIHGVPKAERDERIDEAAEVLQIEAQLEKMPAELSGGQQQRVALGGAFVQDPDVLLLDEPMSDLDAKLKSDLRVEIQRLHQELDTTVVYVTHDQTEAMTMSDQVVLLRDGELAQVDPPKRLFDYPNSEYVAQFIGMPSTNVVDCAVESGDGGTALVGPGFELSLPVGVDAPTVGRVRLGIRPQYLDVGSAGACRLSVDVEVVETLGTESVVHGRLEDGTPFDVVSDAVDDAVAGDRLDVSFDLEDAFVFGEDGETVLFGSERASESSSSPAGAGGVTP